MKKNSIICLFCLISLICFSQNETNIWYFGQNAGLDFNSGSPEPLLNGLLDTNEGCASISDADGNLLFYTDGTTVYNSVHQIMFNGNDLKGNFSSTNSAVIIPKPGASGIYYIFTADAAGGPNGLQYSEVDMALNSGFGGITASKNILLATPVTEKITAVKHTSLDEYWVVAHRHGNNEFLSYRISEEGVDSNPIISSVGSSTDLSNSFTTIGQMKISPNGRKLGLANLGLSIVELFDFNTTTGQVSNVITVSSSIPAYGIEFSPNGRFLYVSSEFLYQYDLSDSSTSDIINSQFELGEVTGLFPTFGALQLASNGKIYLAERDNTFLHVINAPNSLGTSCNYQETAISLGGRRSFFGLPTVIQSSFFVEGFQTENLCIANPTQFILNLYQPTDSIIWNFGDGNTSTEENPTHTYSSAGTYNVTLTATFGSETSVTTQTITVFDQPTITPVVQLDQCDDDTDGFSTFNLNEVVAEITNNEATETITYYETQLDAINKVNTINNVSNYTNATVNSDTIWARVENDGGCFDTSQINLEVSTTQIPESFERVFYQCDNGLNNSDGIATFNFSAATSEIQDLFPVGQQLNITFYTNEADALAETNAILDISNYENLESPYSQIIYVRVDSLINNDCLGLGPHIRLIVEPIPELNLTPDTISICKGSTVELSADEGFSSYLWSTGETTRIITVNEAGLYTVTASNTYDGGLICGIDKTITVVESDSANITEIDIIDWTRNQNIITVLVEGLGDYEYSIDGINYQDSNIFEGLWADEYTVYIRDKNGCGIIERDTYLLYYPRYFTPNGDGVNDFWQIKNSSKELQNEIYIYNRYGNLLAIISPNNAGWDGTYNGKKLPSSDYWFTLKRQNGKIYTGHFTLKR
ncbi:T9SS type B sorting domain-containing protein [Winogradskyella sp.]|uniref:T9SS type B sorting domain-containing protein n=1 Tax=Winogradskyella sp. TaxID=1883156 RepID=UPI0026201026|nr:T9SS type B sorting domain-containing protein [Winogradskyella sp.]